MSFIFFYFPNFGFFSFFLFLISLSFYFIYLFSTKKNPNNPLLRSAFYRDGSHLDFSSQRFEWVIREFLFRTYSGPIYPLEFRLTDHLGLRGCHSNQDICSYVFRTTISLDLIFNKSSIKGSDISDYLKEVDCLQTNNSVSVLFLGRIFGLAMTWFL